jgi:signal transduction histidine kinase/ActR/RegA family two-component response regulator
MRTVLRAVVGKEKSGCRVLQVAGLALVLFIAAATTFGIHRLKDAARSTAAANAEAKAIAIAAHTTQVISIAKFLLSGLASEVREVSERSDRELPRVLGGFDFYKALELRDKSFEAIDVIALFDANGVLLNYSGAHPPPPLTIADRDGFRILRDGREDLVVTASVKNPFTHRWTFYIAQRLESASGDFAGLVLVGLPSEDFAVMFEQARADFPVQQNTVPDSGVAITLLRSDLAVLVRSPMDTSLMGHRLTRGGNYRVVPHSPGLEDMHSPPEATPWDASDFYSAKSVFQTRPADGLPVHVAVAISEDVYLREWRKEALAIAGASSLAAVCVAALFCSLGLFLRRKEAQMVENQRLRVAAEKANDAKTEFLATMSHEVRTPINGILGTADLLVRTDLSERQRTLSVTLLNSAHILLGVIDDILDLSRIESGRLALNVSPFSPALVASTVRDLFAGSALAKGMSLSVEVAPEVPQLLLGDSDRIRQVLVNLVSNAVKFSGVGAVATIVVKLMPNGSPPANTVLCRFGVSDTGVGIPEEARAWLFMPFSQGDSSVGRKFGGTGLGLAISKRLVAMMQGTIDFTSETGRGTQFWFELPLAVGDVGDTSADLSSHDPADIQSLQERFANSGATPLAGEELGSYSGYRVLVVEDDPVNAMIIEAQLAVIGCQCDIATDGGEALHRLRQQAYELVFMDCMLPGMSGYEVTSSWRQYEQENWLPRVPVVALTANALAGNADRCRDAGMDDYLTKPCTVDKLEAVLKRWLEPQPVK